MSVSEIKPNHICAAIVIPARLGSVRMPEKMLRRDTGRALITHTVDAAQAAMRKSAGSIIEVVVATDSEKIFQVVNDYARQKSMAAHAQMTSGRHKSGTDRIAEVVRLMPETINTIINIQGDEPEIPPADVLGVLHLLERFPDAGISTLVRPIYDRDTFLNTSSVKAVLDRRGYCLYFSRSPIPYDRDAERAEGDKYGFLHLGIYGYRRDVLLNYADLPCSYLENLEKLEQLRALGAGVKIVAAEAEHDATGIDTEDDYQRFISRI